MFLKTDGAGNLSFSSDLPTTSFTGATVETSIADSDLVLIYDDSATAVRKMTKANLVAGIGASAGQVIQVVSTTKTDTFSTASTSFVDVTGLSVSITPSSASNKIMVFVDLYIGGPDSVTSQSMTRLMRASTAICVGNSAGSRTQASSESGLDSVYHVEPVAINFLDSPSTTSATTYKVQMRVTGSTHYVNRTSDDSDATFNSRVASTITVMEVKG